MVGFCVLWEEVVVVDWVVVWVVGEYGVVVYVYGCCVV